MSRRRRVTYNQLETLWEILNENRALATGFNKTSQAREHSKRMWISAADSLNSQGDGAEKDWKGWCKYWNDYKCKLKSKVASARAGLQITGGGPSDERRLTDLELKFLQILGEDFGAGLPGVRVEPSFNIPTDNQTEAESAPQLSAQSEQSESILANFNMDQVYDNMTLSIPTERTAASTSSPPAPAPAATPPPPLPQTPAPPSTTAAAPRASSNQRRSPRRRQRRVLPMSSEAARQTMVNLSTERLRIEDRRNIILENILLELREIRGILNNSLVYKDTREHRRHGMKRELLTKAKQKQKKIYVKK